jgi:tetratricopeptide (TPR) repeat protein
MFRRGRKDAKSPGDPRPGDPSRVNAFRSPGDGAYTVVVREGSSLAIAYAAYEQYRQHGDVASLQRAVTASTEAIGSTSDDPLVIAQVHALRCMVFGQAYGLSGQRELLDHAVDSGRQALSLRGPSDPYYPETVARLADVFGTWWEKVQDPDALTAAERLLRDAARTWPDRHPEIHASLSQVLASQAMWLTHDVATLNAAVEAGRTALRLTTPGTPEYATRQSILGRSLMARCTRSTDPLGDIDGAVELFRAALATVPPDGKMHDTLAGYIDSAADIRAAMAGAVGATPASGPAPVPPGEGGTGDVRPAPQVIIDLAEDGAGAMSTVAVSTIAEGQSRAVEDGPVPLAWPLDSDALEDLRWYLEDYLDAPYGVYEDRGAYVEAALARWGQAVFSAVFGTAAAREAYTRMRDDGNLELVFRSSSPALLGLPWELILDSARLRPLALDIAGVSRSLPGAADAGQAVAAPGQRLRVLVVISRPGGPDDVGYRMIARPLLERLAPVRGTVELVVLRPPTLEALRAELSAAKSAGSPYQVVHFDGHGAFLGRRDAADGEGTLVFEHPAGGADHVTAATLAAVLAQVSVPVVVLNACQSGAVGKELEAAVATRLLREGVASVVAMAYTVNAVAAAEFMAAFYEALFAGGTVTAAVTAGRRQMSDRPERPSPKGRLPLADWLVPVHYLRRDVRFPQATVSRPADSPSLSSALEAMSVPAGEPAAGDLGPAAGVFIGRDALFYEVEEATRRGKVVILTGPGGVGKTELAKAFGRWWRDTGGVGSSEWVLWHSFETGAGSSGMAGIIDEIGLRICGTGFALLDKPGRRAAVLRELTEHRMLLIWDNFESVRSMPDPSRAAPPLDDEASGELRAFLADLAADSASSVLITSRAPEDWLGQYPKVTVGGLARHEANEYADALLALHPAASERRSGRGFADLMRWLDGNPLCMRLVLPRLATTDPEDLLASLSGRAPFGIDEDIESGGLWACIAYSYERLSPRAQRLLPVLSLFHGVADYLLLALTAMFPTMPPRFAGPFEEWQAVLDEAVNVGLLAKADNIRYRLHPALPAYLTAVWRAEDPAGYEAERDAAAAALTGMFAGMFSQLNKSMGADPALEQEVIGRQQPTLSSLLRYALDHARWFDALQLYEALVRHWDYRGLSAEADALASQIRAAIEATEGTSLEPESPAGALYLTALNRLNRLGDGSAADAADAAHRADGPNAADAADGDRRTAIAEQLIRSHPELREFWDAVQEVEAARREGRPGDFETWSRKAVVLAERSGEDQLRILTYDNLGRFLANRKEGDDAEEAADLLRKSLAIKEGGRDSLATAQAHHQLAALAYNSNDLDDAERHARASHALNQRGGYRQGLEADYRLLGAIARQRGRLDQAEEWLRRSLVISGELGHRHAMAETYAELGLAASEGRRPGEATKWGLQALAIYEELADRAGRAQACDRLALIASEQGQLGEALMWVITAAALFGEFTHPATAASRIFLTNHVDLQGITALEDCWRVVTGTATPAPIRSYFEARAATRENRKAVAALRKQAEATASLADMREFTLRDLRRAVEENRATRQPPG